MASSSLLGHLHSMLGELALGFSEAVIWEESINQELTLVDSWTIKAIFPKTISQSITFTDAWDDSYNYNLTLTFSDQWDNQLTPTLGISDTLSFTDSFTNTGSFNHSFSQFLVFSDMYSNLKKRKQFTLKSKFGNIILPTPLFGDTDSLNDLLLYKRSMNGIPYTYVNRTNKSKLFYTFQLTKNQAIAFYNWLKVNDAEEITIENWKGEKWVTKILSQSYDFTSVQRAQNSYELLTIPIEFEGTRTI